MADDGKAAAQPQQQAEQAGIPDPRLISQGAISEEALRKAEEFVEQEEGAANRLAGVAGIMVTSIAVAMTLFHLYAAYDIVPTQPLRYTHVAFVMVLCFLLFPLAARFRNRIQPWDVLAAAACVAILIYAIWGGEDFTDRATTPTQFDVVLGVIFIVLLLEATRRTSGWIMPVVAILFIAYAMLGPYLPPPWTHRGYTFSRLVGHLFITLEGIFGVAVDVSSSLIILFTIYGAFLQHSGAGKFFIDFSLALMGGKPNSAGRTVVLSSFLLGGPSGSGVATTVTIGAVAYPMMERARYEKNAAGGLLADARRVLFDIVMFSVQRNGAGSIVWAAQAAHPAAAGCLRRNADRLHPVAEIHGCWSDGLLFSAVLDLGSSRGGVRHLFPAVDFFHHRGARNSWLGDVGARKGAGAERRPLDGRGIEAAGPLACRRLDRRAQRGDHLRVGRHHRRRGHAHRPGTEILFDRARLRRRQPAVDG